MQFILGFILLIIAIGLIVSLVTWVVSNIIGIIGIGLAIWGVYEWKINHNLGAKSKVPGSIVITGLILSMGWFTSINSGDVEKLPISGSNNSPIHDLSTNAIHELSTLSSNDTQDGTIIPISTKPPNVETTVIRPSKLSAKVLEVIDGDTIKVELNGKEETIHLLLIDTPENENSTHGAQPYANEASNFVKDLLSEKTVELEPDVEAGPDKHGRLVYYVYFNDKSLQELLLEKGLARVDSVNVTNVQFIEKYREIEKQAQKKGIGIWSIENYALKDGFHPEALHQKDQPVELSTQSAASTQPKPPQTNVYYKNCKEARAAGAAPIRRGEPGYRPALDRDNDGIACE